MARLKKIGVIILRVGVSLALLFFVFRRVDSHEMFVIMKHADKPLLALAFATFFFNYFLGLFRWVMLLKATQIHLPLKRVISSFAAGIFFNLFLPSTIGGDVLRTLDLAAHTKKPKEVAATVFVDRLSGYVGLVILTLIAVFFGWKLIDDRSVLLSIALISGILVVALLVLFNTHLYRLFNKFLGASGAGKIKEKIKKLHHEIHIFRNRPKVMVKNILISVLVQMITPISFYFIALSIGIRISPIYFFVFLPVVGAITLLPISIGGLGLRDATTVFFFAKAGVDKHAAFAMSLILFVFIVAYGSIAGIVYVSTLHHRRVQSRQ